MNTKTLIMESLQKFITKFILNEPVNISKEGMLLLLRGWMAWMLVLFLGFVFSLVQHWRMMSKKWAQEREKKDHNNELSKSVQLEEEQNSKVKSRVSRKT